MLSSKLKTAALTGSLLLASQSAMAITLTNSLGSFTNFGGFDWASAGTAVVNGFDSTIGVNQTDQFTLTFWASATSILDPGGNPITAANQGLAAFGGTNYEYTILANLTETATCTANNGTICTTASFAIDTGSFGIWYDTTQNVNQVTGAGITDGTSLLTGLIGPQQSGFFDVSTGGSATVLASINYTNSLFIQPDLGGSRVFSTLQITPNTTGWLPPTGLPGSNGTSTGFLSGTNIALQADANQSFTTVPEPASLALLGLGLTGMAFARRRRKQA